MKKKNATTVIYADLRTQPQAQQARPSHRFLWYVLDWHVLGTFSAFLMHGEVDTHEKSLWCHFDEFL